MNNRPLAAIVVVGILALGIIGVRGSQKSEDAKHAAEAANRALTIQVRNAQRTECFRSISASLDHFHWKELGNLIDAATRRDIAEVSAIGDVLRNLPTNVELGDNGGKIGSERVERCPAAPVDLPQ